MQIDSPSNRQYVYKYIWYIPRVQGPPNTYETGVHIIGVANRELGSYIYICIWYTLGGGFKDFLFSPLFGEDSHFD